MTPGPKTIFQGKFCQNDQQCIKFHSANGLWVPFNNPLFYKILGEEFLVIHPNARAENSLRLTGSTGLWSLSIDKCPTRQATSEHGPFFSIDGSEIPATTTWVLFLNVVNSRVNYLSLNWLYSRMSEPSTFKNGGNPHKINSHSPLRKPNPSGAILILNFGGCFYDVRPTS